MAIGIGVGLPFWRRPPAAAAPPDPGDTAIIPIAFYYRTQKEQPMQYLKQATASQSVLIGPFVDSTDGVTPETGLTIANTDIRLSANGGNMAAKNSGGGTHDELGMYAITLDAMDTATVGKLQLVCAKSGALPVYHTFYVLEENVYDAWFAAAAAAGTDLASVLTDTGTTLQAELDAIQAAVITNAAGTDIAADIIALKAVADAVLTDTAEIGAAGAGLTALATAAALVTLDGKVDTIDNFLDTEIAAILADTGTTLDAKLDAIDAVVDAIKLVTDAQANIVGSGTCDSGSSTTSVIASSITPASVEDDQFNGAILVFHNDTTTAALRGQRTDITDYVHSTKTFTVTALSEAPASGDTFSIL